MISRPTDALADNKQSKLLFTYFITSSWSFKVERMHDLYVHTLMLFQRPAATETLPYSNVVAFINKYEVLSDNNMKMDIVF